VAEGCWCKSGGILGLLAELDDDKKSLALESDLLRSGFRLRQVGDVQFTWRDLIAYVRESPQNSAFYRASHPDTWMWDHTAMLMAGVYDLLSILAWQNTDDGHKGKNMPEPMPRPGVVPTKRKITGKALPISEIRGKMDAMRKSIAIGSQHQTVRKTRKIKDA